ncbi:MAG TPA: hypothetical protein VLM18_12525 [Croceibacterium sp.]|nr:hypothetical protein [Croceibacterium sp.]
MHEDYGTIARAQERSSGRMSALLGVGVGAFLLGAALVGLLWWGGFGPNGFFQVKRAQPTLAAPVPTPSASEASAAQARQAVAQVQQVVQQQGGLDSRVAAMEQRMSKLDLQLQAASGNAARTEGLLVAFAARRAVERGDPLGYLADQLELRFGEAHANSVRTIVDFSHDPITLDQLVARLQGLEPELVKAPKDEGAIRWLGREISGLFIIRRASTPSPEPQRRIDRAQLFLESGRIEPAIAEVKNLPNAQEASDWIGDAQRFAAARDALDILEKAAILDSSGLRDSSGQRIQQPSPAVRSPAAN